MAVAAPVRAGVRHQWRWTRSWVERVALDDDERHAQAVGLLAAAIADDHVDSDADPATRAAARADAAAHAARILDHVEAAGWTLRPPDAVAAVDVERHQHRVADDYDQAIAAHTADCAGGWVEPHQRRPAVSDLVHWTLHPSRDRRRWRERLDAGPPVRPGVDLDPPEAHQPALDLDQGGGA